MAASTDNPAPQQRSAAPVAAVAMILLLFAPLLYVFSLGPVIWLYDREYISKSSEPALAAAYVPLEYAHDSSPAVARILDAYLDLWRVPSTPVVTPAPALPPAASPSAVPAPTAVPSASD